MQMCAKKHMYTTSIRNTKDLKVPNFVLVEAILHYDVLENLEDD